MIQPRLGEVVLDDGLVFEDSLPMAFVPGAPVDDAGSARLNAENLQLLSADSSLDEVRAHEALKDESPALVHELQRLDYKLDVLLRLTAQLVMREKAMPAARPVRFSSVGLEWIGADAPPVGATGLLLLYVNPALPQALSLPAVVVSASHNDPPTSWLQFTGLSESVVDLIEKMIFRRHRRMVAGARLSITRSS